MDIKQEITNRIIAMLEKGGNESSPMWTGAANGGFPINGKTGAAYRGLNVFLLWGAAMENGYSQNVWMTYKQAADLGGQVRKGEKSVLCAYYSLVKGKDTIQENIEESDATGEPQNKKFSMCKPFYLFNVSQIDGLPESITAEAAKIEFNPIEQAEYLLSASEAVIKHGGNKAFYSPSKDIICLPEREAFTSRENYYATALHELAHWTGHMTRLNRRIANRFGDQAYSREECAADLTSAMLMAYLGLIDATIENHAAYIESWISVLKQDKTAIFTASKHASAAYDFILNKAGIDTAAQVELAE